MELTIEYIAGFFDGEGSAGIYGANRKWDGSAASVLVQITQYSDELQEELLQTLSQMYGGKVRRVTNGGKNALLWALGGQAAIDFLTAIEPHCHLKREQIQIILNWKSEHEGAKRDEKGRVVKLSDAQVEKNRIAMCKVRDLKKTRRERVYRGDMSDENTA